MIDRKYQVCSGGVSEYELFDKSLGHIQESNECSEEFSRIEGKADQYLRVVLGLCKVNVDNVETKTQVERQ